MTEHHQNNYSWTPPPDWEEGQGWRVVDRDGNVLQSGPSIELEMATNFGEPADPE